MKSVSKAAAGHANLTLTYILRPSKADGRRKIPNPMSRQQPITLALSSLLTQTS